MNRRFIALLLCFSLFLAITTPAFAAKETEKTEPIEVAVTTYSNKTGIITLNGLYQDNVFYISGGDICYMTDAKITDQDKDGIAFSMHSGLRTFLVNSEGRVNESHGGKKVSAKIPTVIYNDQLYISAPDILTYMGATVSFGADETAFLHMMVSMPYTVMDLITEYSECGGYAFSWAEADGKYVDPEDVLELAALDTILLGYDSNVVAYMLPGYAANVEESIHADALLELLRTEGNELISSEDLSVEILSYLSDHTEVSIGFIEKTLDWVAESDLDKQLTEKWGKLMDGAGLVVDMTAGCISSIETVKQFANMSTAQKTLMAKTLCRVDKYSDLYKEYPSMFNAASDVGAMMRGEYTAGEKAAWDGIYNMMGNAVQAIIPPNPISFAWDSLTGIAKLDPLLGTLLQAEANITFASEISDIQYLTKRLYETDVQKFDDNKKYVGKRDTTSQEYLKYDMILLLKAALTARLLLIDTGWLTDAAQASMEAKTVKIAALLNKAQNARAVPIGVCDINEEDISWIEKLACLGKMGNVVRVGNNTYYWKYTTTSFSKDGYSDFYLTTVTNSFVCRDETGKETVLFELDGHGEFIIANRQLFYENSNYEVCSISLDGTNAKNWGSGSLCTVTGNGQYVIFQGYQGSADDVPLYAVDLTKGSVSSITSADQFVTYYNGVIYYTTSAEYEQAQKGKLSLWSIHPDGTNKQHLYTTEPDLYEFSSGYTPASVDQIRFTEDHIYFSYGSLAGTGSMFQGGKVVRVKYDGSDGEVVAGQDGLVDGQFTVSATGTVTTSELLGIPLNGWGNPLFISSGYIYRYNQASGSPEPLVEPGDYNAVGSALAGVLSEDGIVLVSFAEKVNDKVYYLVHSAEEVNTIWRYSRVRKDTAMLEKDLKTGKITVLFYFTA